MSKRLLWKLFSRARCRTKTTPGSSEEMRKTARHYMTVRQDPAYSQMTDPFKDSSVPWWPCWPADPHWPSACWGSSWQNAVLFLCAWPASHGQMSQCPGFSTSQTAPGKQCSEQTKPKGVSQLLWKGGWRRGVLEDFHLLYSHLLMYFSCEHGVCIR